MVFSNLKRGYKVNSDLREYSISQRYETYRARATAAGTVAGLAAEAAAAGAAERCLYRNRGQLACILVSYPESKRNKRQ